MKAGKDDVLILRCWIAWDYNFIEKLDVGESRRYPETPVSPPLRPRREFVYPHRSLIGRSLQPSPWCCSSSRHPRWVSYRVKAMYDVEKININDFPEMHPPRRDLGACVKVERTIRGSESRPVAL